MPQSAGLEFPAECHPNKGGAGEPPARACALRRTPEPGVRLARPRAPVSPLLSKAGTGARPAHAPVSHLFPKADACNPSKRPRASTLMWRGAVGVV